MADDRIEALQELINRGKVPDQHREAVDELIKRGVVRAAAPRQEPVGFAEGTLRQALDAATFGFNDKAASALYAAGQVVGGSPRSFSQEYDQALARSRARTKEAEQQTLPWLIGQTAGNVAQGLATLPAAPVVGAARPAVNALTEFARGIPEAVRYGAAYGSANALGHADGSLGNQLGEMAQGAGAGAIMGPLVYTGMYGAGSALAAKQRWAERRADANQGRLDEARLAGIDNPIPAIVSDSPILSHASRVAGAGIGGSQIGQRAGANINQLTTRINRTLARPIDGQEAGDLGQSVQGDLRRALTVPSRTSDEVAAMSKADLEGITGQVSSEGFNPPRPNVQTVQPRQVDPVQPRDVGPEPQPSPVNGRIPEFAEMVAAKERAIKAATAEHNALAASRAEIEARYKPTFDSYAKLQEQEKTLLAQMEKMAKPGAVNRMRNQGETVPQFINRRDVEMPQQHAAIVEQAQKLMPDIREAQKAMARYGDAEQRIAGIRRLHEERNIYESRLHHMQAKRSADDVAFAKAQEDYSAARAQAQGEAAAETARLQEAARIEAQQATTAAQQSADARYNKHIKANGTGFRIGGSRESYPTELSAAYELSYREAPKIRFNPMGDGYVGTNTTRLLDSVAKEGKSNLRIRNFDGKTFDDEGGLSAPFMKYLRSRIGNDMAQRLEALAEVRSRGIVSQPAMAGMKSLLSDMRTLAREAEKSRYSPQPRTEDAALLRRLATSIQRDLYETLSKAGRPESFKTATADYKVLDAGRTQIGDRTPTDATYYVSPEHFQRLTRGTGKNDSTHSIPATLSLKDENGRIGYFKNREGEFDRSSMIPYSRNPEVGLVPIQVWADGTRITYGSPVISRATTSGERAVSMFKNVDEQYSQYVSELRKPLSKIFGDNVNGVQAMDRLVDAAKKGETGILGAYMRVMTEKSDPTKGAAAVIYHMTGGGKDLSSFMKAWRELQPVSKRILFDTPQAKALERELTRYVSVGDRLEKYVNAAKQKAIVDPTRITHLLTAAAVYTHLPAAIAMVGGNAVAARVLSSPRLVRWMTEIPRIGRGGFETQAYRDHLAMLGGMAGKDKDAAGVILKAINQLVGIGPAKAERFDNEYDPEADKTYRKEGDSAVERPFPVPPYVPPQSFKDSIYLTPPNSFPGKGMLVDERSYYRQREDAEPKTPRMIGRVDTSTVEPLLREFSGIPMQYREGDRESTNFEDRTGYDPTRNKRWKMPDDYPLKHWPQWRWMVPMSDTQADKMRSQIEAMSRSKRPPKILEDYKRAIEFYDKQGTQEETSAAVQRMMREEMPKMLGQ